MKNFIILTSTILLMGCTTSSEIYTSSGEKAYRIECSGGVMSKSDCIKKAGSICKSRGYTEIDYREEAGFGVALADVNIPGPTLRFMTIQCN